MFRHRFVLTCLFVILLSTFAASEIHRTRTSKGAKAYPGSGVDGAADDRDSAEKAVSSGGRDESLLEGTEFYPSDESYSRDEAWIYAMLATVLVGLTGIFPLVLPINIDPSSNNDKGAAKFNCVLSFAVGGLLGDVFLHLLPEAWAHIAQGDHQGHMIAGLWILVGMLVFLSLEKIFGDDGKEEKDEGTLGACPGSEVTASTNGSTALQKNGKQTHIPVNGTSHKKAPSPIINGSLKSHPAKLYPVTKRKPIRGDQNQNGRLLQDESLKQINGLVSKNWSHSDTMERYHENPVPHQKVKVVGYLNLLANFIDNFTHGIAVAGSFLVSRKVGLLTTAAILLHEVPHEVGDFAILLRSGFTRYQAAKSQVSTAVGGLLGALVTLMAESAEEAGDRAAWILPFTAGGFLHISLVTVLPDLLQETNPKESLKQAAWLLAGIAVMATVSMVVE